MTQQTNNPRNNRVRAQRRNQSVQSRRTEHTQRAGRGNTRAGEAKVSARTKKSSHSGVSPQQVQRFAQASRPAAQASRPAARSSQNQRAADRSHAKVVSRGKDTRVQTTSVRLGDIPVGNSEPRRGSAPTRAGYSLWFKVGVCAVVVALVIGVTYGALYLSNAFTIQTVNVQGADHLTSEEMSILAAVPQGSTLLNVDTQAVTNSIDRDAWVESVSVKRVFPDTLEINVTERKIAAIVEVVADNAKTTQYWAIASDGMWLMEIPDQDSDLGKSISPQIYTDAASVLHIKDVPYGLTPEVGTICADENVNNALKILDGLSSDLADQVKTVSATDAASTLLTLDSGIEIAFGTADDIRDKERICLEIMEANPGKVAYINVRVVDRPTWRASS